MLFYRVIEADEDLQEEGVDFLVVVSTDRVELEDEYDNMAVQETLERFEVEELSDCLYGVCGNIEDINRVCRYAGWVESEDLMGE